MIKSGDFVIVAKNIFGELIKSKNFKNDPKKYVENFIDNSKSNDKIKAAFKKELNDDKVVEYVAYKKNRVLNEMEFDENTEKLIKYALILICYIIISSFSNMSYLINIFLAIDAGVFIKWLFKKLAEKLYEAYMKVN